MADASGTWSSTTEKLMKTIDNRYPLPNISEIWQTRPSTIPDLAIGFHQIGIRPNSFQKTSFNVGNGHYEYTTMPCGLKNAPATFQRVMDNLLHGLQGKVCMVYMKSNPSLGG